MDALIQRFDVVGDRDLMICEPRGVAYQSNMSHRIEYGAEYLKKVEGYRDTDVARGVIASRLDFVSKYCERSLSVLDYGSGSGAFLDALSTAGINAKGFEVIPGASEALKRSGLFSDDIEQFDVVTFWDTIEHIENPGAILNRVRPDGYVFISVPIFDDLTKIRNSKHYRPGEHLYYWTERGLIDWMRGHGFSAVGKSRHEVESGREAIGAFAFRKDLPDYHDFVAAYKQIHSSKHYGSSAAELHLDAILALVSRIKPMSILDYGCGRSDLVAHFWRDGRREIARYDPAIPRFKDMPERSFDLVFCCDVLEHIPMRYVDRVLLEVRKKSSKAIFTVSTKLAKAKLPDGANAHVTLMTRSEWRNWIWSYFGSVSEVKTDWDHELMFAAGIGG